MSISKSVRGLIGFAVVLLASVAIQAQAAELNLISDRTDFHLKPLIAQFEEQTGIKVNRVNLDQGGIPARLSANPGEADLIITTDATVLPLAKESGWTQPLPSSKIIDKVRSDLKDVDHNYVALSYRARTMIYNPAKVDVKTLKGYDDLADPKFKGRVCIRPLTHVYNVALVSQMIEDRGEAYARNWVKGLAANLAVKPNGSDRTQAKLIAEGVCDIGIMNSYYFGMMTTNNVEREITTKVRLFFPEQSGKGAYVLTSGAAITKAAKNKDSAVKFVEFLLSSVGQTYFTNATYEYPAIDQGDLPLIVQSFAEGQPGIDHGAAKFNYVNPTAAAKNRKLAIEILSSN